MFNSIGQKVHIPMLMNCDTFYFDIPAVIVAAKMTIVTVFYTGIRYKCRTR